MEVPGEKENRDVECGKVGVQVFTTEETPDETYRRAQVIRRTREEE